MRGWKRLTVPFPPEKPVHIFPARPHQPSTTPTPHIPAPPPCPPRPRTATSPHALAPPRTPPSPLPRCHHARRPLPEDARNPHPMAELAAIPARGKSKTDGARGRLGRDGRGLGQGPGPWRNQRAIPARSPKPPLPAGTRGGTSGLFPPTRRQNRPRFRAVAELAGYSRHGHCARAAPAAPPPPTILQRGQSAGPVLFITAPTSESPTDKPAATPANRPPLQPTGSCSPSVAKPRNPSANNASPAPRRRFKTRLRKECFAPTFRPPSFA